MDADELTDLMRVKRHRSGGSGGIIIVPTVVLASLLSYDGGL